MRAMMQRIARSDRRAIRAIENRIDMLRQVDLRAALRTDLLKQPTSTIYVLRVQSGPVAYRLPFFESPCDRGKLVVVTHGEHRALSKGDRYTQRINAAERRRDDWIRRNCGPGEEKQDELRRPVR